jgi:hypothetical protein
MRNPAPGQARGSAEELSKRHIRRSARDRQPANHNQRRSWRAIADVIVGERHRKDMGDIDGLAASMADLGLLQPIAVQPDGRLVGGARSSNLLADWHVGGGNPATSPEHSQHGFSQSQRRSSLISMPISASAAQARIARATLWGPHRGGGVYAPGN